MDKLDRASLLMSLLARMRGIIQDLDSLQAGDVDGEISPIKHRIMDAWAPEAEQLRRIGARYYVEGTEERNG